MGNKSVSVKIDWSARKLRKERNSENKPTRKLFTQTFPSRRHRLQKALLSPIARYFSSQHEHCATESSSSSLYGYPGLVKA